MGLNPHALYSELVSDLKAQVDPSLIDFMLVSDHCPPDLSVKQFSARAILKSFLKKFEKPNTAELDRVAENKFRECNASCATWALPVDTLSDVDSQLLGTFREEIYRFWHYDYLNVLEHHPYDLLDRGRVGPGAAIGAYGGDFYTKLFSSRLTASSSDLCTWYRRYVRAYPEWNCGELIRQEFHGSPTVVASSRLTFVPKNDRTSRSICVEPNLNMFYQLGFGAVLQARLKSYLGIDLEDQQLKNRELARLGSSYGSFSTIDLESASDTIATSMLKEFLPKEFFETLMKYRTPRTSIDGDVIDLHMISTMGNGFTFPLQCVIFSCAVLASLKVGNHPVLNPSGRRTGNWGVNGDDIIVPVGLPTRMLCRLLHLLGFRVNASKSFSEGPFRESCGADFYRGVNVRGVYVKTLNTPQDSYAVVNQLNLFSTRTGLLFPRTCRKLLQRCKRLYVPRWENDDAGIKVPLSFIRTFKQDADCQSIRYSRYVPVALTIKIEDGYLVVPAELKQRIYNPPGLLISYLQGGIKSCMITSRGREVRYKIKPAIAPNWDYRSSTWTPGCSRTTQLFEGWFNWRRWDTAVHLNIM